MCDASYHAEDVSTQDVAQNWMSIMHLGVVLVILHIGIIACVLPDAVVVGLLACVQGTLVGGKRVFHHLAVQVLLVITNFLVAHHKGTRVEDLQLPQTSELDYCCCPEQ